MNFNPAAAKVAAQMGADEAAGASNQHSSPGELRQWVYWPGFRTIDRSCGPAFTSERWKGGFSRNFFPFRLQLNHATHSDSSFKRLYSASTSAAFLIE